MEKLSVDIVSRIKSIPKEKEEEMKVCKKVDGRENSETPVRVFNVIKNSKFEQMFNFGVVRDMLCFDVSEIDSFIERYPDWIRTTDHEIFFLSKRGIVNKKYIVVAVWKNSGNEIFRENLSLSHKKIWKVEHGIRRIVVPINSDTKMGFFRLGLL